MCPFLQNLTHVTADFQIGMSYPGKQRAPIASCRPGQQFHPAACGVKQAEKEPDRRGLPDAIRPQ